MHLHDISTTKVLMKTFTVEMSYITLCSPCNYASHFHIHFHSTHIHAELEELQEPAIRTHRHTHNFLSKVLGKTMKLLAYYTFRLPHHFSLSQYYQF